MLHLAQKRGRASNSSFFEIRCHALRPFLKESWFARQVPSAVLADNSSVLFRTGFELAITTALTYYANLCQIFPHEFLSSFSTSFYRKASLRVHRHGSLIFKTLQIPNPAWQFFLFQVRKSIDDVDSLEDTIYWKEIVRRGSCSQKK